MAQGELVHYRWLGGKVLEDLEVATYNTVRNLTRTAAGIARREHPYQDRTGDLTNSIFAADPKVKGTEIYAIWGAHFPALYLEYGTVNMPPYPFLRPAADKAYRLLNFAGDIRFNLHDTGKLSSFLI